MPSFTHCGTTGDVFSSLPVVRCLGGGDYYLRLNYMDEICRRIGWHWGAGRHSGRMTQKDFDFLAPLMRVQSCINKFEVYNNEPVEYNLENQAFHHQIPLWPRNFANQYAIAMGLDPKEHFRTLQVDPYVEVDKPTVIKGRPVCIARNVHYIDPTKDADSVWKDFISRNLLDQAFYVGLPEEHAWFEDYFKVKVFYVPTSDSLELARLIAGARYMIANQSMPGTLAMGIGTSLYLETRQVELEQNEVLYPYRANINYF
jgi:hypothetical protein